MSEWVSENFKVKSLYTLKDDYTGDCVVRNRVRSPELRSPILFFRRGRDARQPVTGRGDGCGQGTTEGQEIRWPKVRCVTDHTQLKRRRAAETTMYPWNDAIKRRCQRRPGGFRRHHPRRRRGRIHRKEIEIHKTISRTSDLGKTSEKTRNVPHWKKTQQKIVLTKSTDSGKFEARFRKKEKTRKRTTLKKNTTKKLIH